MAKVKAKEKKLSLNEQAQEIIRIASEYGVEQNFFFLTTFNRYLMQIKIAEELKKSIDEDGVIVEKEYVKGRKNIYTHPAVAQYNKATDSANKTVTSLINIISKMRDGDPNKPMSDELINFLNGK